MRGSAGKNVNMVVLMKEEKRKVFFGYARAVFSVALIAAFFIFARQAENFFIKVSGIKISPRFTGGKAAGEFEGNRYRIRLYEPVFNGLIGERENGFAQVYFEPLAGKDEGVAALEEIIIPGWGKFVLELPADKKKAARIRQVEAGIIYEKKLSVFESGWALRIPLSKRLAEGKLKK